MKCQPFFVQYADTYLLGPSATIELREFRIGLGLIFFEIGLCFISEKPLGYACYGCGTIGAGAPSQLPPEWEREEKLNGTVYFLCPTCKKLSPSELKKDKDSDHA